MEAYSIEHLNFTYPNRQTQALSDISLSVSEGEFITVCGKSGSGKTTLLRLMKPSLAPQGALGGSMRFFGLPLGGLDLREESAGKEDVDR